MEKLGRRHAGFVRSHLEAERSEGWVLEELIRITQVERVTAKALVERVSKQVHARLARRYRFHALVGGLLSVCGLGLLLVTMVGSSGVIVIWYGAIIFGVAEFSYGYHGWRRHRRAPIR